MMVQNWFYGMKSSLDYMLDTLWCEEADIVVLNLSSLKSKQEKNIKVYIRAFYFPIDFFFKSAKNLPFLLKRIISGNAEAISKSKQPRELSACSNCLTPNIPDKKSPEKRV